jgi:hypothetical protein
VALVAYNESQRIYLAAVYEYQTEMDIYFKEEAAYNATKAAYDSSLAKYAAELLEYKNAKDAYNTQAAKAAQEYQESLKKYEAELQAYLALKQNYDNWAFSTSMAKRESSLSPAIVPSYYSRQKSSAKRLFYMGLRLLYPMLVFF